LSKYAQRRAIRKANVEETRVARAAEVSVVNNKKIGVGRGGAMNRTLPNKEKSG
jgi:hypothetical protein